jgi:ketosteroid isomerase-like protein
VSSHSGLDADETMTVERLLAFSAAWNRAALDEVMSFFTEDCVFLPSVEAVPNEAFRGRAAVAREFARIFERDGHFESRSGLHLVCGDFGYCEWSLVVTEDGREVEVRGCDFFVFSGGLIARKDAFRKTRSGSR